jgi:hypothetical protein
MAREEKKIHFIYKITNTKNGKYYLGMHSTDNLEDDYMGSGKMIKRSIRKHGLELHTKEILEFRRDRESLKIREKEIINETLLQDPLCMNLKKGGEGGGKFYSKEHYDKFKLGCKNNGDFHRDRMKSDKNYRENWVKFMQEHKPDLAGEKNGFFNKEHSTEAKEKIGKANSISQKGSKNSQFGTCWVFKTEIKKSIKIRKGNLQSHLDQGWSIGRKIKF